MPAILYCSPLVSLTILTSAIAHCVDNRIRLLEKSPALYVWSVSSDIKNKKMKTKKNENNETTIFLAAATVS